MILKRRVKVKGTICTCEHVWSRPADINGRITVHLNAPETDSEGQTLQIIPSPLVSYCYAASKVPDRPSRAAQTEMSAAVWLGKTSRRCVTKGGRATAISLPQSSSSCPEQGGSFMGNNWHVMEMCFKYYFISKHLQLPSPHILNCLWLNEKTQQSWCICFQNVTMICIHCRLLWQRYSVIKDIDTN